jgi:5'-3' exonuclease
VPEKKTKQTKPKILIDGDIFAYRAAFSCEDQDVEDALDKVDDKLQWAIYACVLEYDVEDYQVFLTGKGNFRYDIATTAEYKGNRKDVEKPAHLADIRQHMIDNWEAVVSKGEEADDLIAIAATEIGPEAIVVTVDKDMQQLPCRHYNPVKGEHSVVSDYEGTKFFYKQILTGDRADNIIGLYRVGPAKAEKMVTDCETEADFYEVCLREYGGEEDRVIENARLLWLRRYPNQLWEPPQCVTDQA